MSPLMGPAGTAVPIAVSPAAFAAEPGALPRRRIAAVGASEEPGLSRKSRDALLDEAIAAFHKMPTGRPALAGRPRYGGERGGIRPPEPAPGRVGLARSRHPGRGSPPVKPADECAARRLPARAALRVARRADEGPLGECGLDCDADDDRHSRRLRAGADEHGTLAPYPALDTSSLNGGKR